ncbi:hypothetical protein I6E68_02195 [Salinibacterium sp. NSLL150]|uniref:hypothetical protein n=1 Tax=unclassified Salinibacterium TaxID=2632331 RepID=UPI0018CE92B3|nr:MULTISPECIES: hypothetical protein [unclassified Salinibacterium]MBH0097946.1 hypothetical protein [Salinibacterium sp. NSLL35]MBH0100701.1 hypothetical protein [Salinibacterium sp. NSLL150]MBH0103460.1 hypothetical protein [Salinibacterium sp. NSLL16]MBH0106221.1 hypothetical protein [Salinibacterium sp. NSLL17]
MSVLPGSKSRKTSTIIRLALASVALVGIGAAATSAAWTAQTTLSASAKAASIELYGALAVNGTCPTAQGSPYVEADTSAGAVAITLASGEFSALVPNQQRTVAICVRNGGDLPLNVSLNPLAVSSNSIFGGSAPATIEVRTSAAAFTSTVLAANATLPLNVVVTTPTSWPTSYQGLSSGAVELVFSGSTDVP